jgi:hypothetical protein
MNRPQRPPQSVPVCASRRCGSRTAVGACGAVLPECQKEAHTPTDGLERRRVARRRTRSYERDKLTVKVVRSVSDATAIEPRWAVAISRAIKSSSPRPAPARRGWSARAVRISGSKTLRKTASRKAWLSPEVTQATSQGERVRKTGRAFSELELRLAYRVELARGASHISSALSAASTAAAVAEVLEHFMADRAFDTFDEFRMLLAQDLMRRQCPGGARAVSYTSMAALSITDHICSIFSPRNL